MNIDNLSREQLLARQSELRAQFDMLKSKSLKLDLTRGKPAADQLDLSNELDGILGGFFLLQDGTDVRNYGGLLGIPEARALGAGILGTEPQEVLAGGNSSLTLMYQFVAHMMPAWRRTDEPVKFLCPVPGYDRHFTICEHFDIEMINIPIVAGGPDMAMVEAMVADDPAIAGIWCVPRYSNPTGHTYSDDTVRRFARLAARARPDFRVFWDNAYAVHHLRDTPDPLTDLMPLARAAGTADSIAMFTSTSKITFAGAGISFLATSTTNLARFEKYLAVQAIGFDKVNQLRHVRFLKDADNVAEHMQRHRALLEPKFRCVQEKLEPIRGRGIADWTDPAGGYFVSLDTRTGLASRVVALANDAGVKLTPAGATFPYGRDPDDRNIRIAPTFPSLRDLATAMDVFVVCLELATVDQLLEDAA